MEDPQAQPGTSPSTGYTPVETGFPPSPGHAHTYPPPGSYGQTSYPPPGSTAQAPVPPVGSYGQGTHAQGTFPPVASIPGEGLADNVAGGLAYITIIPAILFLVIAPYNTRPFVKFHCFQNLGIALIWVCLSVIAIIPILGWIIGLLGFLAVFVVWVISVVKAFQGSYLKLPWISEFAAKQSGYTVPLL